MRNYTFLMFMVDGTQERRFVDAPNMAQAVTEFRKNCTLPYMTALVCVTG